MKHKQLKIISLFLAIVLAIGIFCCFHLISNRPVLKDENAVLKDENDFSHCPVERIWVSGGFLDALNRVEYYRLTTENNFYGFEVVQWHGKWGIIEENSFEFLIYPTCSKIKINEADLTITYVYDSHRVIRDIETVLTNTELREETKKEFERILLEEMLTGPVEPSEYIHSLLEDFPTLLSSREIKTYKILLNGHEQYLHLVNSWDSDLWGVIANGEWIIPQLYSYITYDEENQTLALFTENKSSIYDLKTVMEDDFNDW